MKHWTSIYIYKYICTHIYYICIYIYILYIYSISVMFDSLFWGGSMVMFQICMFSCKDLHNNIEIQNATFDWSVTSVGIIQPAEDIVKTQKRKNTSLWVYRLLPKLITTQPIRLFTLLLTLHSSDIIHIWGTFVWYLVRSGVWIALCDDVMLLEIRPLSCWVKYACLSELKYLIVFPHRCHTGRPSVSLCVAQMGCAHWSRKFTWYVSWWPLSQAYKAFSLGL